MREHLSLKEIGSALDLQMNRNGQYPHAGQCIDPAIEKMAKLLVAYPLQTIQMLAEAASEYIKSQNRDT